MYYEFFHRNQNIPIAQSILLILGSKARRKKTIGPLQKSVLVIALFFTKGRQGRFPNIITNHQRTFLVLPDGEGNITDNRFGSEQFQYINDREKHDQ
ncbi:MAG: hypothetical protein NZL83_03370 [Candidatus Absconditabacterales bacterium]|nr:hypothetical protein [Candidatus Absconditabacterales bacterium]